MAPLAALLGGAVAGTSARMAATTGAHGSWLLRPSFGVAGSRVVALVRLAVVVLWAIIGLQYAGEWLAESAAAAGMAVGSWATPVAIGLLAAVGFVLVAWGLVPTVRLLIRRPLFWGSVVLLGVVAWQVIDLGRIDTGSTQGFWPGVQEATEMAVILVPFLQSVARRLRDDDEAHASFGVGYAVPVTLVLLMGAFIGSLAGGIPADLSVVAAGSVGAMIAIAWIVVAEVDQAFAAFTSGGAEATSIVARTPEWIAGAVVATGVVAVAAFGPTVNLTLGSLLAAIAFPAALISIADFYVAHRQYYSQSELFGAAGEARIVNVVGMASWVVVVMLGQAIDPVGPEAWMSLMPDVDLAEGLPWRLLMALLGATAYLVLLRWQEGRVGAVHELRGVDRQVTNEM